jgi:hypothetical protein
VPINNDLKMTWNNTKQGHHPTHSIPWHKYCSQLTAKAKNDGQYYVRFGWRYFSTGCSIS